MWSTGRVERRNGLWVFRGMPRWAFPRGGVCVGGCFLTGDGAGAVSDAILRHEAVHKRQWQRYGILMPLLYTLSGRDPLRNRFEIDAGLADGNYIPRARDDGQRSAAEVSGRSAARSAPGCGWLPRRRRGRS